MQICRSRRAEIRIREQPVPGSERDLSPPSSDTWGSVIESQADIIKKADNGRDPVPVWAVADAEEVSYNRYSLSHDSKL